jgi:DNA-binding NarL/FixJ family response regulator
VPRPIRVVIVEDNRVFRETLAFLLGLRPGIEVVGAVGSGNEAPAVCADVRPDVVLMDYRMPGLNGVQATVAVLAAAPQANVVCLTASLSPRESEQLLAAGAVACLTKDRDLDQIVAAVHDAAAPRVRP